MQIIYYTAGCVNYILHIYFIFVFLAGFLYSFCTHTLLLPTGVNPSFVSRYTVSQTELAEKAGVTRQTIGLIEAGDFNPSIKLCNAICRALGVTLNDLFWEEEEDVEEKE